LPSLLDAFSYKGTTWAMPQVLNVQSLYYNKSQLKAVGFADPPKTLEEWYSQMTAVRRRITPFIDSWAQDEGLTSDFVRLTAQFGGDLFDAAGKPLLQPLPSCAS
jgi:ABC-type glycerol-3-phosphate transport system substrate-binding protein